MTALRFSKAHYYSRGLLSPRCSKTNIFVVRYDRTINDKSVFNHKLADYNGERYINHLTLKKPFRVFSKKTNNVANVFNLYILLTKSIYCCKLISGFCQDLGFSNEREWLYGFRKCHKSFYFE